MKTKTWIVVIAAVLAISLGLSLLLMTPREAASMAQITSQGAVLRTVDLRTDQEFTVQVGADFNTVTVKNGKLAVTAASRPDHICMHRGFQNGGAPIVCLPNKLVISFTGAQEADFAVG